MGKERREYYEIRSIVRSTCGAQSSVTFYNTECRLVFIFDTRLQIFKAGPNFRPIYFIMVSELRSSNAFPSISCNIRRARPYKADYCKTVVNVRRSIKKEKSGDGNLRVV